MTLQLFGPKLQGTTLNLDEVDGQIVTSGGNQVSHDIKADTTNRFTVRQLYFLNISSFCNVPYLNVAVTSTSGSDTARSRKSRYCAALIVSFALADNARGQLISVHSSHGLLFRCWRENLNRAA